MHNFVNCLFFGVLCLLLGTTKWFCEAFSQRWHPRRQQPSTTRIHARPQDFSSGKIGIPLPLRGFPMPDDDEDDEEDSLPPPVQSFLPPLQPNPIPSVERAKLSKPPYKPMEPEPPKPPPIGIPQKWEEVPPNFAKPKEQERASSSNKPKFSLFGGTPTPDETAPPEPAPDVPPVVNKPSFSLFSPAPGPAPTVVEPPTPAAEKPAPFSLFKQEPAPAIVEAPAPTVEEKPVPLSLFKQEPAPAFLEPPAPAVEEKPAPFSMFKQEQAPAVVEPPAPVPEPAPFSLLKQEPAPANVERPLPLAVETPSAVEPPPAVMETSMVETPPPPPVKEPTPLVKNESVLESTTASVSPNQVSAIEPTPQPAKAAPIEKVKEPLKALTEKPEPAPQPQVSVESPPPKSVTDVSPPPSALSVPPPSQSPPSSASPLQSLLPKNLNLDRISTGGVAPLVLVPLAALAAGRSLLTSRASKQKDLDDQLKRLEERKQKELSGTNSLVFTVLGVAALSIISLFLSVLETSGPAAVSSKSTVVKSVASLSTTGATSAPSALLDAVQLDRTSSFSTKTIAGLWSEFAQAPEQ